MRVPDLLADLFAPEPGEIRPDSPAVRPDEIQPRRGFSPNSPLSPREGEGETLPLPTTRDDLRRLHGAIVAGCVLADVLAEADDTDLPELRDRAALEGFARALLADRRIRPLPDPALPPLARIAAELGDEPGELREYLDRTGPGRALRVRLERQPGAVGRALLALRDDPDGGLLPVLARALNPDPAAGYRPESPPEQELPPMSNTTSNTSGLEIIAFEPESGPGPAALLRPRPQPTRHERLTLGVWQQIYRTAPAEQSDRDRVRYVPDGFRLYRSEGGGLFGVREFAT